MAQILVVAARCSGLTVEGRVYRMLRVEGTQDTLASTSFKPTPTGRAG